MKIGRITPSELITQPKRSLSAETYLVPGSQTPLTHEGRTQTLREWARELRISETTLRIRLRRGWTVERALTKPRRRGDWDNNWKKRADLAEKRITHDGQTLPVTWWARVLQIPATTLIMRLQRGATIEEALRPGRKKNQAPRCSRCRDKGHRRTRCAASIYYAAMRQSGKL